MSASRVERIGERCFQYCGFRSVLFPKRVQFIEDGVFYNCGNLASLRFGKGAS